MKQLLGVLTIGMMMAGTSAWANDCSWSALTQQEQRTLLAGESIMRHSADSDGTRSHIDQWGFSKNPSLFETVANFYDESDHKDAGSVADISLAEGEVASNNPVIYNVVPKSNNPFGKLYQPFSFSSEVKISDDAYLIRVNYLSSPGLIKHVLNDVCFAQVDGKVLIRFLSTVTDNPNLPITGAAFGWITRKVLWKKVFLGDVERASVQAPSEKLEHLKLALKND